MLIIYFKFTITVFINTVLKLVNKLLQKWVKLRQYIYMVSCKSLKSTSKISKIHIGL